VRIASSLPREVQQFCCILEIENEFITIIVDMIMIMIEWITTIISNDPTHNDICLSSTWISDTQRQRNAWNYNPVRFHSSQTGRHGFDVSFPFSHCHHHMEKNLTYTIPCLAHYWVHFFNSIRFAYFYSGVQVQFLTTSYRTFLVVATAFKKLIHEFIALFVQKGRLLRRAEITRTTSNQ
jgi:hypothetical protein